MIVDREDKEASRQFQKETEIGKLFTMCLLLTLQKNEIHAERNTKKTLFRSLFQLQDNCSCTGTWPQLMLFLFPSFSCFFS